MFPCFFLINLLPFCIYVNDDVAKIRTLVAYVINHKWRKEEFQYEERQLYEKRDNLLFSKVKKKEKEN